MDGNLYAVPATLFAGLPAAVEQALSCRLKVRHPGVATADLERLPMLVHAALADRWARCAAGAHVARSRQNWRWCDPVTTFAEANRSPEVWLERDIATAAVATDAPWANQIPVASGLPGHNRRRALDLVRQDGPSAFTFVELKIKSDTPLYATYELLAYASAWLLTRAEPLAPDRAMLRAEVIDLVVLAPQAWYKSTDTTAWAAAVDAGAKALGAGRGVNLSFRYAVLEHSLEDAKLRPQGAALLAALDRSVGVSASESVA